MVCIRTIFLSFSFPLKRHKILIHFISFKALLGVQAVITLVMISLMQKLKGYSLARWLLCSQGLYRYLYPTDSELKALTGKDKTKGRKGGKHESNGKKDTFHVPRNLEINLEKAPVTALDVVHLRFYTEYYWIVDFSLYTALVYVLSEVSYNFTH